jgi:ABC-type lipoprotein release transport system permease subunit
MPAQTQMPCRVHSRMPAQTLYRQLRQHLGDVLNPGIAIVAFLFSAAVGVVFSYSPALKAARLDPIEALRHQ